MRLPEYWKDWKDCNPAEKTKLLPCPFCGGKAVYIFDDGADWNKGIACKKCELNIYFFKKGWNVSSGRIGSGLEDKIAIAECWNRRAKVRTLTVSCNFCGWRIIGTAQRQEPARPAPPKERKTDEILY